MIFYILNPEIKTVGTISKYKSMAHTRQFAGSGSFKLIAPFTDTLFERLVADNILYWEDAGKAHAACIESIICEYGKDGLYITASGKNLRAYLGRRVVWENINFSGTVEDFGRQIVTADAISPSNPARKVPLLSLAARKGLSPAITRLTENENVEDLLDDISGASGVGFDILLDRRNKLLYFTAYEGVDRRTTQTTNPWVIVSRDRNNVIEETYTRSRASFRNSALIAGYVDEDTGERYEAEINAGNGLARRELFVRGSSRKPKPDESIGETEAAALTRYRQELIQKGREKLAKQVAVQSLEVEPDSSLFARLDVGDKVTAIEKQYNLSLQTYISEITTYYGKDGRRADITLGEAVPTIYQKIRKELK